MKRLIRLIQNQTVHVELISTYKREMMGIGTVLVLLVHASDFGFSFPDSMSFINKLMTYGQIGVNIFLIYSGIGVVFSLRKYSTCDFFFRRFKRVLIPYFLITIPYCFFDQIVNGIDSKTMVLDLLTLSYWTNHRGAWYVSVILVYYLISPQLVRLYKTKKKILLTILIFFLSLILWNQLYFSDSYFFNNIATAFIRLPMFCIGILLAFSIRGEVAGYLVILILSFFPLRALLGLRGEWIIQYSLFLFSLGFLISACFLFERIKSCKLVQMIMWALRWIGDKSLEIYLFDIYLSSVGMTMIKWCKLGERVSINLIALGIVIFSLGASQFYKIMYIRTGKLYSTCPKKMLKI